MKFLFALLAVLSVVAANDFQIQNSFLYFPSDIVQSPSIALKNLDTDNVNAVTFVLSCPDSGIVFSYPSGASYSNVGSIQKSTVGYGVFYAVATSNVYTVNVNVTYKKGSSSSWSYESHTVFIDVYDDDDDKREVASGDDVADNVADDAGSDIALRTNNIYCLNTLFSAEDLVATWVSFDSKTGSSALNSVSFTIVPDNNQVSINYPPTGNSLGSIAANTEKDSSFQVTAPYNGGTNYNLNVTYKYKIGTGSYQYLSYSIPLQVTCVSGCRRNAEARSIANEEVEVVIAEKQPVITEKQPFQFIYVAASGAGVAVVAVVSIVGTLLYRRRTTETSTA